MKTRFLARRVWSFGHGQHAVGVGLQRSSDRQPARAAAAARRSSRPLCRSRRDAERVAFLAGEPDRWRNVPDLIMKRFRRQLDGSFLRISSSSVRSGWIRREEVSSFR